MHYLHNLNPSGFRRLNDCIREIFPNVKQVTSPPTNQEAIINVWSIEPDTERWDLAVQLSESGTGIGQVLAILYVVVTADEPKIILIDEPQSFLHPGAVRKLFEILQRYKQHQFIISTHSPLALTAIQPSTIHMLQRSEHECEVSMIDVNDTQELKSVLVDVGARLSDVFGADEILWVEGKTEEVCIPLIIGALIENPPLGTQIIGIRETGDFDSKDPKKVLEVYRKLSSGFALLPPPLGFIFDRESRTDTKVRELEEESDGQLRFLNRRMFENYLLNPDVIASVTSQIDGFRDTAITRDEVASWLDSHQLGDSP